MPVEFNEATFNTISNLILLSTMAEIQAKTARNIGNNKAEEQYISISAEALDCAKTLFIKAVSIK